MVSERNSYRVGIFHKPCWRFLVPVGAHLKISTENYLEQDLNLQIPGHEPSNFTNLFTQAARAQD
jgi:hypothetical protein